MCPKLFNRLPVEGILGCFQFYTMITKVSVNICGIIKFFLSWIVLFVSSLGSLCLALGPKDVLLFFKIIILFFMFQSVIHFDLIFVV